MVYYRNRSSNQLLFQSLPITAGFDGITANFPATVQNSGWEFSISTENIKGKSFSWSSNLNLTIPKNKLIKYPGLETSFYASQFIIGESIGIARLYPYLGVNQQTGLYEVRSANGSPTSMPNSLLDNTSFVDTFPKFFGGFSNTLRYNGFSLDLLFQFGKRNARKPFFDTFSGNPGEFYGESNIANYSTDILQRWNASGQQAQFQKVYSTFNLDAFYAFQAVNSSTYAFTDVEFLRLKNVSLSWILPETLTKKIATKNLRIYAQGQNLWTITGYEGLDPEAINNQSLPPLRVITFGIQASF
jgi:hypothetical protein